MDNPITPQQHTQTTNNIVTQSSQETEIPFSLNNIRTEQFVDDLLDLTIDSPLVEQSTVQRQPTTLTDSPNVSRGYIRQLMEDGSIIHMEMASAARSLKLVSNTSSQARYTPKNSLLMFLRDQEVDSSISKLEAAGQSLMSVDSNLQCAKRC